MCVCGQCVHASWSVFKKSRSKVPGMQKLGCPLMRNERTVSPAFPQMRREWTIPSTAITFYYFSTGRLTVDSPDVILCG